MAAQADILSTIIFSVLCIGTGLVLLGLVRLMTKVVLKTGRHSKEKDKAYECGMPLLGEARQRFGVKFYLVALSFVLFDVETVFLLPYAVAYKELGASGFYAMLLFVMVLGLGLFYELKRGLLDWSEDETTASKASDVPSAVSHADAKHAA